MAHTCPCVCFVAVSSRSDTPGQSLHRLAGEMTMHHFLAWALPNALAFALLDFLLAVFEVWERRDAR